MTPSMNLAKSVSGFTPHHSTTYRGVDRTQAGAEGVDLTRVFVKGVSPTMWEGITPTR